MFKSYVNPTENKEANRQLPRLLFEGLLLGGTGLGVLALIFEIAADAFSVAAYQTLLAIHGAQGHHEIAILAFIVLSILLYFGIVPAYKAGAYLRPNAGGSGPLVEAIGPKNLRWLSWAGASLFFLDAILTIIISSISAADVTMLVLPELAPYRILLAELYAFFIMVVLVAMGPKRAVPLFLMGGGAFTIFTVIALGIVGVTAMANPEWAFLTHGIVDRLHATGVVEHVVQAQQEFQAIGTVLFFQLFFRSMSSAMLGFSGYEVIPASGKHAARPKWKVINTSLTLAALFLILTGVVQLYAAKQWKIPATEGYSTLLIEYEIASAQTMGPGITPGDIIVNEDDIQAAERMFENLETSAILKEYYRSDLPEGVTVEMPSRDEFVKKVSNDIAFSRTLNDKTTGTLGKSFLVIAGVLLAIILLFAQGGGYVGGAAVAATAARLGRLPGFLNDDRIGIGVIWGISAILIPIIREVVVVEAYYAFGFVSAFVITSTTVFFVRNEVLKERGIEPGSGEAKSLRFAGLRGMIASYFMLGVLVTQKTDALWAIVLAGGAITIFQIFVARGGLKRKGEVITPPVFPPGTKKPEYDSGVIRAHAKARQRGIVHAMEDLIEEGAFEKFNVDPDRIRVLVTYLYNIEPEFLTQHSNGNGHGRLDRNEEPSPDLQGTYNKAFGEKQKLLQNVENYSHFGIFTFIHNYHINWVSDEHGRNSADVQRAMLDIMFPLTDDEQIWQEYSAFVPVKQPEPIWQFSRRRYLWAKDQWPNLSDRITTVWTLQDFGLLADNVDIKTVISVAGNGRTKVVTFHPKQVENGDKKKDENDSPKETPDESQ